MTQYTKYLLLFSWLTTQYGLQSANNQYLNNLSLEERRMVISHYCREGKLPAFPCGIVEEFLVDNIQIAKDKNINPKNAIQARKKKVKLNNKNESSLYREDQSAYYLGYLNRGDVERLRILIVHYCCKRNPIFPIEVCKIVELLLVGDISYKAKCNYVKADKLASSLPQHKVLGININLPKLVFIATELNHNDSYKSKSKKYISKDIKKLAKIVPQLKETYHKLWLLISAYHLMLVPTYSASEIDTRELYWYCQLELLKKSASIEMELEYTKEVQRDEAKVWWRSNYSSKGVPQTSNLEATNSYNKISQLIRAFQTNCQTYTLPPEDAGYKSFCYFLDLKRKNQEPNEWMESIVKKMKNIRDDIWDTVCLKIHDLKIKKKDIAKNKVKVQKLEKVKKNIEVCLLKLSTLYQVGGIRFYCRYLDATLNIIQQKMYLKKHRIKVANDLKAFHY